VAVDDEHSILNLIRLALAADGFEVRTAHSVDEALAILATWLPDYIVSDYCMPHKTGEDFFEVVLARHPDIIERQRFIFLSAFTDSIGVRPRQYDVPILQKPVRLAELRALFSQAAASAA